MKLTPKFLENITLHFKTEKLREYSKVKFVLNLLFNHLLHDEGMNVGMIQTHHLYDKQ
jgi:hypothetical protein